MKAHTTKQDILTQAKEYIKSQGFHLMTKDDIPRFAECAAEAYQGVSYPLTNYFMGHPCTKEELRTMWLFNLKCLHSKAVVYSDCPECNAWFLWIPPGFKGFSIKDSLLHGGINMIFQLGLPSIRRMLHYEDYALSVRMQATKGQEWYLYNAAVRPEAQGKHLAARLMRPMLDFCALQQTPIYLETHHPNNVNIYQHLGFTVFSGDSIPGTTLTHWGMVRMPAGTKYEALAEKRFEQL